MMHRILTAKGKLPAEMGLNGMPFDELHYKKDQCTNEKCTITTSSVFANFNQSTVAFDNFVKTLNDLGMNLVSVPRKKATAMLMAATLLMCKKGDIVETGVFKGGSSALIMKYLLELDQCGRKFYIFDSFEGLPDAVEKDSAHNGLTVGLSNFSIINITIVFDLKFFSTFQVIKACMQRLRRPSRAT